MTRLLLLLALTVPARASERVREGRAFFNESGCRSCHAVGGVGGNAGPDLTLVGHRRSRAWLDLWLKDPRGWKHDTLMPDLKLREAERAALVDYLSLLRTSKPVQGKPRSGAEVFARAGCVACHGAMGRGGHPNNNVPGSAIPALPELAATFTKDELVARLKKGKKPEKADPQGEEPLVSMPAWEGVLTEEEISAVADFVLALASKDKKAEW
jgi:mono/diheme cytochrome c family protein